MPAEQTAARRSAPIDRPSAANAALVGMAAGLLAGALTSPLQGWLADSASSLANSAGTWSLVAFLVSRRSPKAVIGALVAALTLATCELGYVLATEVRGGSSATSTVAFWIAAAILAGPPLGVAALWSRASHPLRRGAGFGVISGVLVGEGIYGLTKISDTTDWRYWSAEIAVAAGIVGRVALRNRSVRVIGSCIAMAGAAAVVVYVAAVSA
ncbi:MAG: DUF6518 family protein [Ilumatobacteraceae bacterium]